MKKINLLLLALFGFFALVEIPGYREIILWGIIVGVFIIKDTPNINLGIKHQLIWNGPTFFIISVMFPLILFSSPESYKDEIRNNLSILVALTINLLFVCSRVQLVILNSERIKKLAEKSPKYGRTKIASEVELEVQNKQNLITQIILGISTILFLILFLVY